MTISVRVISRKGSERVARVAPWRWRAAAAGC
jgi:hypothetical protein